MYLVDSPTRRIDRIDFDPTTGELGSRKTVVALPPGSAMPDGLTVDAEGFIWVAMWDGWAVGRYDPTGRLERTIRVSAARVASLAFGGPALDELYITTARGRSPESGLLDQPHAGGLFRCRPGVLGRPPCRYSG